MFLPGFRTLWLVLASITAPEKEAPPTMQKPTEPVEPIISSTPYQGSIENLLRLLEKVDWDPKAPNRMEELRSCYVARIEHYRTESRYTHEMIVLTVIHGVTRDMRYVRLERFKQDGPSRRRDSDKSVSLASQTSCEVSLSIFTKNADTASLDHARINDKVHSLVGSDYRYVQSFNVSPHKFDILDAIVLATSITAVVKTYSPLHHMCLWWAHTFFRGSYEIISSRLVNPPSVKPGPLKGSGGKVGRIRLVQETGHLSFPGSRASDERQVVESITEYLREQDIPDESINLAIGRVQDDLKKAKDDKKLSLTHILIAQKRLLDITKEKIEEVMERVASHNRTQSRRDEEEGHLKSELHQTYQTVDTQRQEIEMLREQITSLGGTPGTRHLSFS